MIMPQTVLNVADNSGATKIMCIHVLGGTRRRYAAIGDIIVAAVKEAIPGAGPTVAVPGRAEDVDQYVSVVNALLDQVLTPGG